MTKTRYWHTKLPHTATGEHHHIHYANDDGKAYLLIMGAKIDKPGYVWPVVWDSRKDENAVFDPANPFFTFREQLKELGYPDTTELEALVLRKDPVAYAWAQLGLFEHGHRRVQLMCSDDEREFRLSIWDGNYSLSEPDEATSIGTFHDLRTAREAFYYASKNAAGNTSYTDISIFMQQKAAYKPFEQ